VNSDTKLTFGPYKGRTLLEVPAGWLLNIFDESTPEDCREQTGCELSQAESLWRYINENREYLEHEHETSAAMQRMKRFLRGEAKGQKEAQA
jgi:hypothetical protein